MRTLPSGKTILQPRIDIIRGAESNGIAPSDLYPRWIHAFHDAVGGEIAAAPFHDGTVFPSTPPPNC